jgi:hypothetical protein
MVPTDALEIPPDSLPENIIGFAIASFIRDYYQLVTTDKSPGISAMRLLRLALVFGIAASTFALQAFIIYETKQLVTPPYVQSIRTAYSDYQNVTYRDDDGTPHLTYTKYGGLRGIHGHYNHNHFQALSAEEQDEVCKISLSQPWFIFTLLFIWTTAVTLNLRSTCKLMLRFLLPCSTGWNEDMGESVEFDGDSVTVNSLPVCVKVAFCWFLLLPNILVTVVLLWLGCRFLLATMSFGDILRNAVALCFILGIPELMFRVLVPMRGRLETARTKVRSVSPLLAVNVFSYFAAFSWMFVSGLFVVLYMVVFQDVLPLYNWDVHTACESRNPVM